MARRIRSDARIGTIEKKLGIGNSITNPSGRNARSDKNLGSLRKSWGKFNKKKCMKNAGRQGRSTAPPSV